MGKLKIEGQAKKEYEYDVMEITVRFQSFENTTAKAIKKVMQQCENCLSILESSGINISNIRIGEDSVEQDYEDGDISVCATREIILRLSYDIKISNYIMDLVSANNYNVDIDVEPVLSNPQEIYNELLKEAINDSKEKAMIISEITSQKVLGIDSINIERDYNYRTMDFMECEQERGVSLNESNYIHLDKLANPKVEKSAKVDVVWIIE